MIKAVGLFFLMLLKILGWLLLALLIILLAVILFVLFVPVRYRVTVQNERTAESGNHPAKNLQAQVKVGWLLHFFQFTLNYGQEGVSNEIRVAGLNVRKVLAQLSGRKKARQNKADKKKKKEQLVMTNNDFEKQFPTNESNLNHESVNSTKPAEIGSERSIEEDSAAEKPAEIGSEKSIEEDSAAEKPAEIGSERFIEEDSAAEKPAEIESINSSTERNTDNNSKKQDEEIDNIDTRKKQKKKKESKKKPFSGLFLSIRKKLDTIKNMKSNIHAKLSFMRDKIRMLYGEITDPGNRSAAGHVWKELCYLLLKYKPRKVKADLTFSLADPALTGEVLGLVSLFPHVYRYPYHIIADFDSEQLYIEGELMLQGKVTGYVVAVILIRLIRDKEFLSIVRRLTGRS